MNESTSVAEYNPIAAGLAVVRQRYANVAWDLKTTKGNADARAARKELVTLRVSLESKRVELKAPVLERAKLIDSEAKRITAELLKIETPIDEQIERLIVESMVLSGSAIVERGVAKALPMPAALGSLPKLPRLCIFRGVIGHWDK